MRLRRDLARVDSVVGEMRDAGLPPDEATHGALVSALVRCGQLERAAAALRAASATEDTGCGLRETFPVRRSRRSAGCEGPPARARSEPGSDAPAADERRVVAGTPEGERVLNAGRPLKLLYPLSRGNPGNLPGRQLDERGATA